MAQVLAFSLEVIHSCNCITCSVPIFMDTHRKDELRRNHASFYCINGHGQCYPAKSDLELLREQVTERDRLLAAERERAAMNYAARERAERALKKINRRVSGGACPCCNRSFRNVQRHMKTKHPEFIEGGTK